MLLFIEQSMHCANPNSQDTQLLTSLKIHYNSSEFKSVGWLEICGNFPIVPLGLVRRELIIDTVKNSILFIVSYC